MWCGRRIPSRCPHHPFPQPWSRRQILYSVERLNNKDRAKQTKKMKEKNRKNCIWMKWNEHRSWRQRKSGSGQMNPKNEKENHFESLLWYNHRVLFYFFWSWLRSMDNGIIVVAIETLIRLTSFIRGRFVSWLRCRHGRLTRCVPLPVAQFAMSRERQRLRERERTARREVERFMMGIQYVGYSTGPESIWTQKYDKNEWKKTMSNAEQKTKTQNWTEDWGDNGKAICNSKCLCKVISNLWTQKQKQTRHSFERTTRKFILSRRCLRVAHTIFVVGATRSPGTQRYSIPEHTLHRLRFAWSERMSSSFCSNFRSFSMRKVHIFVVLSAPPPPPSSPSSPSPFHILNEFKGFNCIPL